MGGFEMNAGGCDGDGDAPDALFLYERVVRWVAGCNKPPSDDTGCKEVRGIGKTI